MKSLRETDGEADGCEGGREARSMTGKRSKKPNAERSLGTKGKEVTGEQNVLSEQETVTLARNALNDNIQMRQKM